MSSRDDAIKKYGEEAKHWTDSDCELYVEVGKIPEKTKRGNWIVDIKRTSDLPMWRESALADWLDGFILTHHGVTEDDMWKELRRRYKIPGNWTNEAIRTFILRGIKPVEVAPGILEDDKVRNEKKLTQLSFTDMRLILEGKVKLKFTKEEIYAEIKTRLELSPNFPDERIFGALPFEEKTISMNNAIVLSKLQEYQAARKNSTGGRRPTIDTHAVAQVMLYNMISQVMSRVDYPDFVVGWELILDFINVNYEGLFDPTNAMIGLKIASLSKADKDTFADVLNLMIQTRAPQRRKAIARMYDIQTILRNVKVEQRKINVTQYYAVV